MTPHFLTMLALKGIAFETSVTIGFFEIIYYSILFNMSFKKLMKGVPPEISVADGFVSRDQDALTSCQAACTTRLGVTLQMEQEDYLLRHPEVIHICKFNLQV